MLSESQSIKYFLLGCVPARLFLAYLAYILSKEYLKYYSAILIAIGAGFMYLYFTNGRLKAPEGGGKTWWAHYRIIHGFLYLMAGYLAYKGEREAFVPLFVDVLFGVFVFGLKRYFRKID